MFLNHVELLAKDQVLMSMQDCQDALVEFLEFNRRSVLKHKGTRSRKQADAKAKEEFKKFQAIQDQTYENDFEKENTREIAKLRQIEAKVMLGLELLENY